jgi:hypothetical protein
MTMQIRELIQLSLEMNVFASARPAGGSARGLREASDSHATPLKCDGADARLFLANKDPSLSRSDKLLAGEREVKNACRREGGPKNAVQEARAEAVSAASKKMTSFLMHGLEKDARISD